LNPAVKASCSDEATFWQKAAAMTAKGASWYKMRR
jgi:hypothetical protein